MSIQNADDIRKQIVRKKPSYMTDYEYRKMMVRKKKKREVIYHYKKSTFLCRKREYLQSFREREKEERKHFRVMSKMVQMWTTHFLFNKMFKQTRAYMKKRNEDKRRAMARFGSIATIEKVLGKFLKSYKETRPRRCMNKIRFSSAFHGAILHDHADHESRKIFLKFFRDRKAKSMMFYCFKSVERKVQIIQKRLKCKAEVNKERINFLKSFWNNELTYIYNTYEMKESKTKMDKKILSMIFQIDPDIRDVVLKEYFRKCIEAFHPAFKTWHQFHKKIVKESTAVEILKNAFNYQFDSGEDNNQTGVQSLLKQKTLELRRINTIQLVEDYIDSHQNINHFSQVGYDLQYKTFRMSKPKTKRIQRLRHSMIDFLEITIPGEGQFEDLYKDEDYDPNSPPVFVFIPCRNLVRLMIVDAILETSIEYH